ncbi:hypothetical protein GW17_00026914 [Ensete ventricosum]|uniref:Uncharacterized protein n=1 Tax=Ensete ventricosum TaxID=4639 RepID=A0A444EGV6_ENSVE|nr:hypothetical protein GW17_00026914 [Ensete ventricosum]RZR72216.1 hypothetical protein BHM03_00011193 [Ensete ventricosum]
MISSARKYYTASGYVRQVPLDGIYAIPIPTCSNCSQVDPAIAANEEGHLDTRTAHRLHLRPTWKSALVNLLALPPPSRRRPLFMSPPRRGRDGGRIRHPASAGTLSASSKEPPSPELIPKDAVLYQYEAGPHV